MKQRPREPRVPPERHETVRKQIIAAIEGREMTARDLSVEVGISEREVHDHLEHIRKTMSKTDHRLILTPASCKKCGFVFAKRERLKKPGRCPVCHGESIEEPIFSIKGRQLT